MKQTIIKTLVVLTLISSGALRTVTPEREHISVVNLTKSKLLFTDRSLNKIYIIKRGKTLDLPLMDILSPHGYVLNYKDEVYAIEFESYTSGPIRMLVSEGSTEKELDILSANQNASVTQTHRPQY